MSKFWDAQEWWDRTDRLHDMFKAYRAELQQIDEQLTQPLDAKAILQTGVRLNRMQWRIQVLGFMIKRHLERGPDVSTAPTHLLAAEMRLH